MHAATTLSSRARLTELPPWIPLTITVPNHIVHPSPWSRYFSDLEYVSETLNAFLATLDTLGQHADSIKDILLNYLSSINVLGHVAGLHLQASHICECAVADGIVDEEGDEDEDAPLVLDLSLFPSM